MIMNVARIALLLATISLSFLIASGFVFTSKAQYLKPLVVPLLQATKDSSTVAFANNATISPSETKPTTDASEFVPMRQQVLKIQSRLEEIHERNANGEKLSQEYCDSILGLCVAAEEWESVLDVLDVMKNQNLSQEHSTYRSCLSSCFEMANGESAQEILQAMAHALVKPEPADISLAVAAMCRNNKREPGWWRKALELLLDEPSAKVPVEAYDAVFACMVDERQWKDAVRLLREMERGSTSETSKAPIHPKPTVATYREVIECCVAAEKVEQAVQVITSMTDQGVKPTVYTFELVISALARKLQWRRALQLLDLMGELKVPKTILTYNTIISSCAKAKEVGMAKNLLSRMRKEKIKPSIVTYNSVISACASTSRWRDALSVLDQCNRDPNCTPDIYTYTNAIRACAKGGKTERALSLHDVVKHKKLPLDSYCYAAVIEACAKAKLWQKALGLLNEMEEKRIVATDVIYSVTITACGNGGQWQKALDLLDVMRDKGMQINLITYNAAITALAKAAKQSSRPNYRSKEKSDNADEGHRGKLWTRALQLLERMESDGIKPDGFSYSSAISCCGADGRWEEALELIDRMKKGGPRTRPNKIAYTAAISACGRAGEYEHALRLFRNMKEEGLVADKVAYNALFHALRIAEKPDLAYELWEEMCGTKQSNTTAIATARAVGNLQPDIITVSDVIATLACNQKQNHDKVDEVFAQAVQRGIVLRSGTLDTQAEVDLSGMPFPVARAACRYVVSKRLQAVDDGEEIDDLTFITGVGASNRPFAGKPSKSSGMEILGELRNYTSLRDYLQEVLRDDFDPPIDSFVPKRAQGTVQIDKAYIEKWSQAQQNNLQR